MNLDLDDIFINTNFDLIACLLAMKFNPFKIEAQKPAEIFSVKFPLSCVVKIRYRMTPGTKWCGDGGM